MTAHLDPADTLTAGAQFYDLRHAPTAAVRARAVADALDVRGLTPRVGLLDLGAGTGVATRALAEAWPGLPVFAAEPARSMRVAFLTALAGRQDLVRRITLLPGLLQDLPAVNLTGRVDVATAFWVLSSIRPEALPATLDAVAGALRSGGVLVAETPGSPVGADTVNRVQVGEHVIEASTEVEPRPEGGTRWRFGYRWLAADGSVLVEESDEYLRGPDADVAAALARAGFVEAARFADPVASGATFSAYRR